jgi:hypothetical protein
MVSALVPGSGELTLDQRHELMSSLQNPLIAGHLMATALIGTMLLVCLVEIARPARWKLCVLRRGRIRHRSRPGDRDFSGGVGLS